MIAAEDVIRFNGWELLIIVAIAILVCAVSRFLR